MYKSQQSINILTMEGNQTGEINKRGKGERERNLDQKE